MRRLLTILAVFTIFFSITACVDGPSADERLAGWIATLELPLEVNEDFNLPSELEDATVVWTSSHPEFITDEGIIVKRPIASYGDVEVLFTATFTYRRAEITETYVITLLAKDPKVVTSVVPRDFDNRATEYIVEDGIIDVYYMDNHVLPYVDVESFLNLVKGAIVTDQFDITYLGSVLTILYEVTYESVLYDDDLFECIINFDNNTVTINRFGFFSSIAEATQTDFGTGLTTIDYIYNATDPVVFELTKYEFELVIHQEGAESKYLMPLHLANLFFTGSMYDVYYNGDKIYGIDTYQITGNTSLQNLLNNSKRGQQVPLQLKIDTYNFMAFTFDHFFGLKEATGVEDHYEIFEPYYDDFIASSVLHYRAVAHAAYRFDDLHTWHLMPGYYADRRDFDAQWNPFTFYGEGESRIRSFYDAYFYDLNTHCTTSYPGVRYFEGDTVAIIVIDGFTVDTPDQFRDHLLDIQAKGTVTKVVVDLSCNTGGIIGPMLQTIAYMTDDPIAYHTINAGDGSTSTTLVGSENVAFNFEWYVLTSPITYSAANLMTSIVKEMGIATIVGRQSTGGASSITTNILPSGTILIMSSPSVLTNQMYQSIEFGIPVHIQMPLADIGDASKVVQAIVND